MAGLRSARPVPGRWNSRRWQRRWAALAAVVAVVAVAVTGCGRGPVPGSHAAGPARYPTSFFTCTPGGEVAAQCRYVWVPQDWAHPHGARMPLLVAVMPATVTSHPATALFYLAGWGQSAVNGGQMTWAGQTFGRLNQTMDLVFVAQRGTPLSWPQTCPGLTATAPAALRAAVRHCLASASRSPRHDTTAAAARDLEQVRKVLGYHKINLYGGSYGVSLGLAYLQRYSAHVRSALFTSGSLLNVPLWQLTPIHAQQAFDHLAARCAATPACARAYHPAADLAAVASRLRAHPARVTITGPSGRPDTVTIRLTAFLNLVVGYYLSSPDTAVLLPEDLHAFARGQWAKVIAERGFAAAIRPPAPTQLQEITIRCGDAWAAENPATIAQQNRFSVFTPDMAAEAAWQQQLCALWPHDPGVSGVVHSTVPVVFVNGTADLNDPPANVAAAPRTMPNALLVTIPGGSHEVAAGGCLSAQAATFILAGKPANRSTWAACARTLAQQYPAFPPAP
jgi:pimeloyl-ACP methyl ester carboxylesterase